VLWRAKSDVSLPVLQVLPDGSYLSRIADPAASCASILEAVHSAGRTGSEARTARP
jgi:hypothetical protein